jgi:hypothetical protein
LIRDFFRDLALVADLALVGDFAFVDGLAVCRAARRLSTRLGYGLPARFAQALACFFFAGDKWACRAVEGAARSHTGFGLLVDFRLLFMVSAE